LIIYPSSSIGTLKENFLCALYVALCIIELNVVGFEGKVGGNPELSNRSNNDPSRLVGDILRRKVLHESV
jgi:hypothetical protein